MQFTKMHGAGNDYVYVNCFQEQIPDDVPKLAREISNRHFGVGGDGLILICPSPVADALLGFFPARVFSDHASKPRPAQAART